MNHINYRHYQLDLKNKNDFDDINFDVFAIFHLAASIDVGEGEEQPLNYYTNNIVPTLNLLQKTKEHDIELFVFTSTAAVYGDTEGTKDTEDMVIKETSKLNPVSVYGESKLVCEKIIRDFSKRSETDITVYRFFNVGAGHNLFKAQHHLIESVVRNMIINKDVYIFGNDYKTPDGTCIRDFVHIDDLVQAFDLTVKKKLKGESKEFDIFNIGCNKGFSVREVVDRCKHLLKSKSKINIIERRPGDSIALVADNEKITNSLEWKPTKTLDDIILDTAKFLNE